MLLILNKGFDSFYFIFFNRLPIWHVFCKDSLSSAVQYASGDACALANDDENVQEKVC